MAAMLRDSRQGQLESFHKAKDQAAACLWAPHALMMNGNWRVTEGFLVC